MLQTKQTGKNIYKIVYVKHYCVIWVEIARKNKQNLFFFREYLYQICLFSGKCQTSLSLENRSCCLFLFFLFINVVAVHKKLNKLFNFFRFFSFWIFLKRKIKVIDFSFTFWILCVIDNTVKTAARIYLFCSHGLRRRCRWWWWPWYIGWPKKKCNLFIYYCNLFCSRPIKEKIKHNKTEKLIENEKKLFRMKSYQNHLIHS